MTSDPAAPRDDAASDAGALLTRAEASAFLETYGIRLKPATLARLWAVGGNGPPCIHVRGKPFYPSDILDTWARGQITGLRAAAPPAARRR